jgi:GTP-binding protein
MVIGIHSRDNDLVVNPIKGKKLTNIRAAGKDDAVLLTPPIALTLEFAVEFIADDELVEVTPKSIRIRKRFLKEHERKRASRLSAAGEAQASQGPKGTATRDGGEADARAVASG